MCSELPISKPCRLITYFENGVGFTPVANDTRRNLYCQRIDHIRSLAELAWVAMPAIENLPN
jgi:hypothetical protein